MVAALSVLALTLMPVAAHAAPAAEQPSDVVGEVAGQPITLAEVEAHAAAELVEARRAVYEARRGGLEALVEERLLAAEAAARGVTVEALLAAEVEAKVSAPTEAEIDEVYVASRDRLGGRSKEDVRDAIVSFLRDQRVEVLRSGLLASLASRYPVRRLLDPPRMDVSVDDDAARGPADAPVTIVEFSDYQCPYCARVEPTVSALLARYGDKIRLVFRDFPLPFHEHAALAAQATECAEEHGKFWELHDALFAQQDKLDRKGLAAAAHEVGVPRKAFEACLDEGRYAAEVEKDAADAAAVGVRGTPAFFVNGVFLGGAQPLEAFVELVEAELARAK